MKPWPVIAIAGPTATGKTALAVELAQTLGSEIFSMDSRQVYRGLDLGTGKDLGEYHRFHPSIPYHLIDVVDPAEIYGLYRFQGDCYAALETFRRRRGEGVPPILVGGTGLYLESILKQFEIPQAPEDPELRSALMLRDFEALKEELLNRFPELAGRTDFSSKKRIVRALEIGLQSDQGKVLRTSPPSWKIHPLIFVTQWDRAVLRKRIESRLDERLKAGMVEEVESLRAKGLTWERLDALGMEYREVSAYLRGAKSRENMRADLLHSIHLLAKRQETYFRGFTRRGLATIPMDSETGLSSLLRQYQAWRSLSLDPPI